MEQNNFEKNVRQKMEEFNIPPSDSVWANVEKRINKKEKKRRLIFILFFSILFLLSGGYWILHTFKNGNKENQQISNVIKTEKENKSTLPAGRQVNKTDSSFEKSKVTPGDGHHRSDSSGFSIEKKKISHNNSIVTIHSQNKKSLLKVNEKFTPKSNGNYSKPTNKGNSDFALHNIRKLEQNDAHITEAENKINIENLQDTIQKGILNGTFLISLKTETSAETLLKKEDSSIKKISKNPDINRWHLGITFSGGVSLIGGGLFEGDKSLADMNAGAPFFYNPSPIKNSTAFTAGVFIEKNISAKTKFSFGLSYKYYSLVNKVGNRIALAPSSQYLTSSNSYYSSANVFQSYRNNFHFLEVPISFTIQLNRNKNLPLSWNAGVNISQLISSNALQFQSNPGVYYNDNSLFDKTQFGLSTGMSATLFSKQKIPVTIGPYFYYGASKLADKGLYGRNHFSYIGIRMEILLPKK